MTQKILSALVTVVLCLLGYTGSWVVVHAYWPALSAHVVFVPDWLPLVFSYFSAVSVFWVITHMQRGCLEPTKLPFQILYEATMFPYLVSTIHPTQYNVGTATMELAFFSITFAFILGNVFKKEKADFNAHANMQWGELFKTTRLAAYSLVSASMLVWLFWPTALQLTAGISSKVANTTALFAGFVVFAVILHVQRGKADPQSIGYMRVYLGVVSVQLFSTMHRTEYNLGTAVLMMSFFLMVGTQLWQRLRAQATALVT